MVFVYKKLAQFTVRCALPPRRSESPVCATDNKPSCVLHLLGWFIGSRGFPSLERRPEFWVLHLGARPGSGKPRTQYQPQREAHLQALQLVQQEIWKPISAAYRADNPVPCPHAFKIGDTVLVRRYQTKTLEPHWKGPYTVLLMKLTPLKVDGIAA